MVHKIDIIEGTNIEFGHNAIGMEHLGAKVYDVISQYKKSTEILQNNQKYD